MAKIIFMGDSLTWGGYGGNFVNEVAKLLPDDEIINKGDGGATAVNLLEKVERIIELEPDKVFVMVGGNDAISFCQPKTRQYYKQVKRIPEGIVTQTMFAQAYRDLLSTLQQNFIQAYVGLPPVEQNPTVVKHLREYNQLAAEIARSMSIPVLDFVPHFTPDTIPEHDELSMKTINLIGKRSGTDWDDYEADRQAGNYTFTFDGLHLLPESAKKMAKLIVDFLEAN